MKQTLGPYELIARLGSGGMATVYQARDSRDGRYVALKVLHDHRSDDPDYVRRFEQEARLATRLHHPNIVEVYEAGAADGQQYLAMEPVEGETLADRLARRRRLRPDEARSLAIAVGSALEEAHRQRIAHRDIKPGNVLMGHDGSIKVSDFGIARALDTTSQTMTGTFLGSVAYASPEAIEGRTDPRGDLYSLGVVLYQVLLGHVPFEAGNAAAVMRMHERDVPPDLERLHHVDAELGDVVERLLAKDPDDRYQSASHLLRALNAPGRGGGRWGGPIRWIAVALGGFALAAGGAVLALVLTGALDNDDKPAGNPTPTAIASTASPTPDPRTPTPNPGTATALAFGKTAAADTWIRAAETSAARETQTATAGTRTPTPVPTATPPGGAEISVGSLSPPLNTTVSEGQVIDLTLVYEFPEDGRSVRFTAYFRLPLSSGIASVSSNTIMPNDSGRTPLRVTANRNGAVFCGYVVEAGDGVRLETGCVP